MSRNSDLLTLLSSIPARSRDELISFLAFSERETREQETDVNEELLVSLSFFNASTLRPN